MPNCVLIRPWRGPYMGWIPIPFHFLLCPFSLSSLCCTHSPSASILLSLKSGSFCCGLTWSLTTSNKFKCLKLHIEPNETNRSHKSWRRSNRLGPRVFQSLRGASHGSHRVVAHTMRFHANLSSQ